MQPITSRTFLQFQFVSDPRFSPNGNQVAFAVKRPDEKKNGYTGDLYLLENGSVRPLTQEGDAGAYTWTEQGNILFQATRGEEDLSRKKAGEVFTSFYEISPNGGQAKKAFEVPLQSASLTNIGGGKYAVLGRFDNETMHPAGKKGDVTELNEIPYWGEFGLGFTSGQRIRLYVYDTKTASFTPVTGPWFNVINFRYGDGKIAYTGQEYHGRATKLYGLYVYDVETGENKTLIEQDKMHMEGCCPFGDQILFWGNTASVYEPYRTNYNFYLIPAKGGEFVKICDYLYNVGGANGATDAKMGKGQVIKRVGDRLYFTSTYYDGIVLRSVGLKGDIRDELTDLGLITGFDISCEGKMVHAATYGNKMVELYEGKEQLTHFNDELLQSLPLSTPKFHSFVTDDGIETHGWVMEPVGYEKGKQYPAILHIHGGPQVVFSDVFHYEMQYWANNGYFVFFCNPRGSDGRGFDFENITGRYGDWDYKNLMSWFDKALACYPDVDQKRLGVTGGSYGGYMTNWIIGQTDRFAAAVSQRSIANWVTFEYTAIRGYYHSPYKHGYRAGENPSLLWDCSPLKYAERCTTPTLFIHSDNDHVCWMSEGLTMFAALKTAGCETKLCLFHNEDHELSRSGKPTNRIRRMEEILAWFDHYLKK